MTQRDAQIRHFLAPTKWSAATRDPLDADASNRSYERLELNGHHAILMNAPPDRNEPVTIFANVTEMLRNHDLSAPEIYAQSVDDGLMLIEDLGHGLFANLCADDPSCEMQLYKTAIDLLVKLHAHAAPSSLPPYDMAVYLRETNLLTDWYLPAATGAPADPDTVTQYQSVVQSACAQLDDQNPILVMRDYHAENLLWLPDRSGIARVGLLDYQDALAGHRAYDLVSLLEDARRDTAPNLQKEMLEKYIGASGVDRDIFLRDYCILGAQRNLKIIGIFARLSIRDGKDQYVDLIPRVWAHLMHDLAHPQLSVLRDWVAENVPTPTDEILEKLRGAHA